MLNSIGDYYVEKYILIYGLLDQNKVINTSLKVVHQNGTQIKLIVERVQIYNKYMRKIIIFYSKYNFIVYLYYDIIFPINEIYVEDIWSFRDPILLHKLLCFRMRLKGPVHRAHCSRKILHVEKFLLSSFWNSVYNWNNQYHTYIFAAIPLVFCPESDYYCSPLWLKLRKYLILNLIIRIYVIPPLCL